eukprot:8861088-Pyramimonas_sp.AAC.1
MARAIDNRLPGRPSHDGRTHHLGQPAPLAHRGHPVQGSQSNAPKISWHHHVIARRHWLLNCLRRRTIAKRPERPTKAVGNWKIIFCTIVRTS